MKRTLRYGAHPDQVVDLHTPDSPGGGVAVLVHGGYWRAPYAKDLMDPLAADLVTGGWVVANVEYRRVGAGGGWPVTRDDVRTAVQEVCSVRTSEDWPGPVVAVGHSAGGHLALLAADLADAVVALAPITDLVQTRDLGLDEDAVRDLIPEHLVDRPDTYRDASPAERLPVGRPVLVVHGDLDDLVPQQQSLTYVARARAAGDPVELHDAAGVDHFHVIDPAHPSWRQAAGWMDALRT